MTSPLSMRNFVFVTCICIGVGALACSTATSTAQPGAREALSDSPVQAPPVQAPDASTKPDTSTTPDAAAPIADASIDAQGSTAIYEATAGNVTISFEDPTGRFRAASFSSPAGPHLSGSIKPLDADASAMAVLTSSNLFVDSADKEKTGTFSCQFHMTDMQGLTFYTSMVPGGSCKAVITTYGPVGGKLEGTFSGDTVADRLVADGGPNVMVPFSGKFSVIRKPDSI